MFSFALSLCMLFGVYDAKAKSADHSLRLRPLSSLEEKARQVMNDPGVVGFYRPGALSERIRIGSSHPVEQCRVIRSQALYLRLHRAIELTPSTLNSLRAEIERLRLVARKDRRVYKRLKRLEVRRARIADLGYREYVVVHTLLERHREIVLLVVDPSLGWCFRRNAASRPYYWYAIDWRNADNPVHRAALLLSPAGQQLSAYRWFAY